MPPKKRLEPAKPTALHQEVSAVASGPSGHGSSHAPGPLPLPAPPPSDRVFHESVLKGMERPKNRRRLSAATTAKGTRAAKKVSKLTSSGSARGVDDDPRLIAAEALLSLAGSNRSGPARGRPFEPSPGLGADSEGPVAGDDGKQEASPPPRRVPRRKAVSAPTPVPAAEQDEGEGITGGGDDAFLEAGAQPSPSAAAGTTRGRKRPATNALPTKRPQKKKRGAVEPPPVEQDEGIPLAANDDYHDDASSEGSSRPANPRKKKAQKAPTNQFKRKPLPVPSKPEKIVESDSSGLELISSEDEDAHSESRVSQQVATESTRQPRISRRPRVLPVTSEEIAAESTRRGPYFKPTRDLGYLETIPVDEKTGLPDHTRVPLRDLAYAPISNFPKTTKAGANRLAQAMLERRLARKANTPRDLDMAAALGTGAGAPDNVAADDETGAFEREPEVLPSGLGKEIILSQGPPHAGAVSASMPPPLEPTIFSHAEHSMVEQVGDLVVEGPTDQYAPQLRLEDGDLIIDQESLVAVSLEDHGPLSESVVQEHTSRVTSASFRLRRASAPWTQEETEKFFEAVEMCNTDLTLIAQLFPARDRRQIKTKFKREERVHPERLAAAVAARVPLDPSKFSNPSSSDSSSQPFGVRKAAPQPSASAGLDVPEPAGQTSLATAHHRPPPPPELPLETDDDLLAPVPNISDRIRKPSAEDS